MPDPGPPKAMPGIIFFPVAICTRNCHFIFLSHSARHGTP
jgi:hypothetical protein